MKKTILGLTLIGCLSFSFANEIEKQNKEDNRKEKQEQKKEKILNKINERMSKLEKTKICVKNANSKEDMDKCRPDKPKGERQNNRNNNDGED